MISSNPMKLVTSALLMAGIVGACSEGGTGPQAIPDVAGNYTQSESLPAATCTGNQLPAGGTVVLEAFTQSYPVRIEQTGSAIRLIDIEAPDDPVIGTIDSDGKIALTYHAFFQEAPRGSKTFFDDLTITLALTFDKSTGRISGTGNVVNVFHEGSTTAPVYATCSRGVSISLTPRS